MLVCVCDSTCTERRNVRFTGATLDGWHQHTPLPSNCILLFWLFFLLRKKLITDQVHCGSLSSHFYSMDCRSISLLLSLSHYFFFSSYFVFSANKQTSFVACTKWSVASARNMKRRREKKKHLIHPRRGRKIVLYLFDYWLIGGISLPLSTLLSLLFSFSGAFTLCLSYALCALSHVQQQNSPHTGCSVDRRRRKRKRMSSLWGNAEKASFSLSVSLSAVSSRLVRCFFPLWHFFYDEVAWFAVTFFFFLSLFTFLSPTCFHSLFLSEWIVHTHSYLHT